LIILLTVPLAALVGLGIFTRLQLERIEAVLSEPGVLLLYNMSL
jgi:hypothetical protein